MMVAQIRFHFHMLAAGGVLALILLGAATPASHAAPAPAPVVTPAAAAAAPTSATLAPETVVMRVNGEPIEQKRIEEVVNQMMMRYLKQVPPSANAEGRTDILKKRAELRQMARQQLVDRTLIDQAVKPELEKVKPEIIEQRLEKMRAVAAQEGIQLDEALKKMDRSVEDLKKDIRQELATVALLEVKHGSIEPTEEQLHHYFDTHKDALAQPEQVRLSELVIFYDEQWQPGHGIRPTTPTAERKLKVRQDAQLLLDRLKKGEEFAALARQVSKAPSASQGGDMGFFSRDKTMRLYAPQAWTLKPGELSGLIDSAIGVHIIKVTEKREAHPADFAQAHDKILEQVRVANLRDKTMQWLGELHQTAKIEDLVPDPPLSAAPKPAAAAGRPSGAALARQGGQGGQGGSTIRAARALEARARRAAPAAQPAAH